MMFKAEMPHIVPLWMPDGQTDRFFELLSDWRYLKWNDETILIEIGFVTNFASIPRLFRNIYSPIGILLLASFVHDHIYQYEYYLQEIVEPDGSRVVKKIFCSRSLADEIFEEIALISYPKNSKAIKFASTLLSLGGGSTWNECRDDQKRWMNQ